MPLQLQISLKRAPQPTNTSERDFTLWVMAGCKSFILPTPRSLSLVQETFCILSLSYQWFQSKRQWCTDRWNSSDRNSEKMNELLECVVDSVNIASGSWTANHQHFLFVVVHRISSGFKNHLVLHSFATWKTGPAWKKWWYCGKSVWECFCCHFLERGLLLQQTMEPTTWSKRMRNGGNRKMALYCCSHVEQVIKSIMKRVGNNNNSNSVDLLPKVLRTLWSSTQHFRRKWKRKRGIKKINDYPETKYGATSMHVYKDILEKKWDKLCVRWKKKSEEVVVESDFFFQETIKVTLITLKLVLEPLFFFALELLFQNSRLDIFIFLWYLLWNHSNNIENTWLWH